jgi:hypothetical protein
MVSGRPLPSIPSATISCSNWVREAKSETIRRWMQRMRNWHSRWQPMAGNR